MKRFTVEGKLGIWRDLAGAEMAIEVRSRSGAERVYRNVVDLFVDQVGPAPQPGPPYDYYGPVRIVIEPLTGPEVLVNRG